MGSSIRLGSSAAFAAEKATMNNVAAKGLKLWLTFPRSCGLVAPTCDCQSLRVSCHAAARPPRPEEHAYSRVITYPIGGVALLSSSCRTKPAPTLLCRERSRIRSVLAGPARARGMCVLRDRTPRDTLEALLHGTAPSAGHRFDWGAAIELFAGRATSGSRPEEHRQRTIGLE